MFTARRPSNGALEMPAPRKRRSILQVLNRGAVAMRRASKPTLSHSPSSSGTDISAEGGMEAAIDALQHARQSGTLPSGEDAEISPSATPHPDDSSPTASGAARSSAATWPPARPTFDVGGREAPSRVCAVGRPACASPAVAPRHPPAGALRVTVDRRRFRRPCGRAAPAARKPCSAAEPEPEGADAPLAPHHRPPPSIATDS